MIGAPFARSLAGYDEPTRGQRHWHRHVVTFHMASARCKAKRTELGDGGFVSVRGQTYEGCLQPVEERSLRLEVPTSKGSGSA